MIRAFERIPVAAVPIEMAEPATRLPERNGQPQGRGGPLLGDTIDLRLLVIAAEEGDPNLIAITDLLKRLGTPFDVIITSREGLAQKRLWHESHAYYQGVILASGSLDWYRSEGETSALHDEEWQILSRYEARFGIRQVVLHACGSADQEMWGLRFGAAPEPALTPLTATLTDAGRQVFWYLNGTRPISLHSATVCQATMIDDSTVPLLVTPEGLDGGRHPALRRRP